MARRREKGGIAIEFGLTMPLLLLTIAGGLQIGRALITRHSLAEAVSYATRAAALTGNTSNSAIQNAINLRLGLEAGQCTTLTVQSKQGPGAFAGGKSLQVQVTCQVQPLFKDAEWSRMRVPELVVTAAMPL